LSARVDTVLVTNAELERNCSGTGKSRCAKKSKLERLAGRARDASRLPLVDLALLGIVP
jgi:hypothetical protein